MPAERRAAAPRLVALEGLRGLAAVAVVAGHILVASSPALASLFFGSPQPLTGTQWLLARTPLATLWAGQEWVMVFFVLSGVVLSLGAAGGAPFQARRYYPVRLARLYLPVWGALVFAAVVHELVGHVRVPGASPWLNHHAVGWSTGVLLEEVTLVARAGDYYFTTVLWSLRWEVLFSLALPAVLLLARRFPPVLLAAGSFAAVAIAGDDFAPARYMPAFVLGVALAFGRDAVGRLLSRRAVYAVTAAVSLPLLSARWWLPGAEASGPGIALVTLGAVCLCALGMHPGAAARLLSVRPLRALGAVSFSLYLVHEPIVVATAFALGGRPGPLLLAACALPLVAVATVLFHRGVERPSLRLARHLGRREGRRSRVARGAHAGPRDRAVERPA